MSIFLLGDITQLPPVQGKFIFEAPKSHTFKTGNDWDHLWEKFSVVNLVTNHRQGSDKEWADLLNRMRIGETTDEDMKLLNSRIRKLNDPEIPNDAMYVAGKRDKVHEINTDRLDGLETEGYTIESININSACRKYHPLVSPKDGRIDKTSFMKKLEVKTEARVMMIHNVDTSDHLVNGAIGEVLGFEKNDNGEVTTIHTHFYDEKAGQIKSNDGVKFVKVKQ